MRSYFYKIIFILYNYSIHVLHFFLVLFHCPFSSVSLVVYVFYDKRINHSELLLVLRRSKLFAQLRNWPRYSVPNIAEVQGGLFTYWLTDICFFSHIHTFLLFPFYLEYTKNWMLMLTDCEQTDWRILGAGGREICGPNSVEWPSRSSKADRRI